MISDFKQQLNADLFKVGKIVSLVAILVLSYFIYSDIYFRDTNELIFVRLIPISLFLIFYLGSLTKLTEKKTIFLITIYYLSFFALLCMNYRILFIYWNSPLLHVAITGLIVSSLSIYLSMRGSIYILASIYLVPSLIFIIYALNTLDDLDKLLELTNCFALMLIIIGIYAHEEKFKKERFIVNKQMKLMAYTDSLTKLENRRGLWERLKTATEQSDQNTNPTSIIMLDIDKFKPFNDIYGHDCGDFVLIRMSEMLLFNLRKNDIAARWGGEEFMVFLPNTNIFDAQLVAEKLRSSIEEHPFIYEKIELFITVTIGVSEFYNRKDLDMMIKNADAALYKGKERGGNCVVTFN